MKIMNSASSTLYTQRILETNPGQPGAWGTHSPENTGPPGVPWAGPQGPQEPLFPESTGSSLWTWSRGTRFCSFLHLFLTSRPPSHSVSASPRFPVGLTPLEPLLSKGTCAVTLLPRRRSPVRGTDSPPLPPCTLSTIPPPLCHQPCLHCCPTAQSTATGSPSCGSQLPEGQAPGRATGPLEKTGVRTSGLPKVTQLVRDGCKI